MREVGAKGGTEKVRSFVTFFWDGLPKALLNEGQEKMNGGLKFKIFTQPWNSELLIKSSILDCRIYY